MLYNSLAFSIFTGLCNHRHNVILENFHKPKRSPVPMSSPFPAPLSAGQPPVYFLSLWVRLLCTFHINGIIQYVAFCD